jgi:hypothetical protein
MWLHNKKALEDTDSKFAILNADDSWLKYQNYPANCKLWIKSLINYDWSSLFEGVEKKIFEKRRIIISQACKVGIIWIGMKTLS